MNNQLTINELRAYQAGQLDGLARHRVERLLLEDPFYADALEGLEALQRTGASLPKQTAQLRRALHERINESATERRLFPLWVTTMAASIVLVMGVALYFIYTTTPNTTAIKKAAQSIHSESIVVEMGSKDPAINKIVETVAVLEAYTARLRTENRIVGYSRPGRRGLVSSQAALFPHTRQRPASSQVEDATVASVIELAPARTGPEQIASAEPGLTLNEPKVNYRRIIHPERAFGPNPPEAPDVTFWSDATPRLTIARSFVATTRLVSAEDVMAMNKGYVPLAVSSPIRLLKRVEGTITNQQGEPLSGVQVSIKGTSQGTMTNAAGQFSFDSSLVAGRTLGITYIGFKAQEISPLVLKKGPIQLTEDTQALSEVVVTGYGRAKPGGSRTGWVVLKNLPALVRDNDLILSGFNEPEKEAFREYLKKEASPLFHGPLSVVIRTKADGSIKRVSVEDGILIEEPDGKRHREYKPTPEVRAEAERLARQYGQWPKKRQSLLWIMGWNKP
ncbi:MAG: carboxypeptidase-like regulatory domain-containing protein [Rudanella sp.]|nr:carboxypeptidase-like regulatory domain-containing protein [Rudanella sp.]